MANKPTDLPVWATDANYPAGSEPEAGDATKVEPIASKQALGWRPDEKPPAEHLNWWKNLVYLWTFFLDAIFTTVSSKTHLTIDGNYHFTNPITRIIPAQHGRRISTVNPPLTYMDNPSTGARYHEIGTGIDPVVYQVPIALGERIVAWRLHLDDTSNGGHTARLFKYNADTNVETALGTLATTPNNPGYTTLSNSALTIDATSGKEQFYLFVIPDGGAGTFNTYHLEIDVIVP